MTKNGRFVIVAWDGGGNVPPALAIGKRLRQAGHRVSVVAPPSLRGLVDHAGLDFRGFRHGPDWGSHLRRMFDAAYLLEVQCGVGVGQDLESELGRERADAVLVDWMLFGALASAERWHVSTAALAHTLYQVSREGGEGSVWDDRDLATTNETRRALGLVPITEGGGLWDAAELVLVLVPRAFDRPGAQLPANVHYVGPVLDKPASKAAWDLPWPIDHTDPLVLVGFSTTYMAQENVLQRILDAIGGLRVRALVTAGPSLDASALITHANTVVRAYVDHQAVLPHTSVVVTHAGLSTVMAALGHGVPLLCIPMGRDQGVNSERVHACGAGRTISPDSTVEELRAALTDLLESPTYRHGAQRMADIIKGEADGSMVVPLLEGLLTRNVV